VFSTINTPSKYLSANFGHNSAHAYGFYHGSFLELVSDSAFKGVTSGGSDQQPS
jgi:hypothetical protein